MLQKYTFFNYNQTGYYFIEFQCFQYFFIQTIIIYFKTLRATPFSRMM